MKTKPETQRMNQRNREIVNMVEVNIILLLELKEKRQMLRSYQHLFSSAFWDDERK